MRFRTAVLVGAAGLVLGLLAATLGAVAIVLERSARARVADDLDRGRRAFEDLHAYRRSLRREEIRVVADEPRLKAAQPLQHTRKKKQKISRENLEASRLQEPACCRWGERYGITVEGNAMHDVPRPRIPGVVFPKGPETSRT